MAKKEKTKGSFSIDKLPVGLAVAWTFLSAIVFGALGAFVIITIARTF